MLFTIIEVKKDAIQGGWHLLGRIGGFGLFLHYSPSCWDVVVASCLWQCAWASECLCSCRLSSSAIYPVRCRVRRVPCSKVDIYRRKLAAIVKHIVIASGGKCGCWQLWSRCQGGAVLEHVSVAAFSKCRNWQGWSRCQGCAVDEHVGVAAFSKCRCWQLWNCRQG